MPHQRRYFGEAEWLTGWVFFLRPSASSLLGQPPRASADQHHLEVRIAVERRPQPTALHIAFHEYFLPAAIWWPS